MQSQLKIRLAIPGDLPLIAQFTDLLVRFHGEHENRAIAYAVCTTEIALHRNQRCLQVHLFYVLKAHRRTGVAQQMVTFLLQMAQVERASALTVSVDLQNEAAQ